MYTYTVYIQYIYSIFILYTVSLSLSMEGAVLEVPEVSFSRELSQAFDSLTCGPTSVVDTAADGPQPHQLHSNWAGRPGS